MSYSTGRVQVVVLLKVLGVTFVTIMGLFPQLWTISPIIIALYLLRTGVNNAGYPLQKSILMDYVPKVRSPHILQLVFRDLAQLVQHGYPGINFLSNLNVRDAESCLNFSFAISLLQP